ncbi:MULTISPECIES: septum formation inhibitor Maf [Campylobacter]|uniref:Nucleoside triphosphate pyrophosphatase n=1 Tax=Campylobacter porcelli TaxID=1660073 RepID=A0A1X9SVF7_9BACT|nr:MULTISPECIES: septum formation inhibitor Maf [unclassified Campylobacter]ARR00166.1 septum formation protein Maf [Campylobacter sp. RM6137]MCR8679224.1 septum formation inhibitor Maf [Campylobacter sp. RM19072]MCR8696730.1 septum formation inhibitor Maf [Campylobacter sp. RM19073]
MIVLASSSASRALILKEHGVEFIQVCMEYDENFDSNLPPAKYAMSITNSKAKQFFDKFKNQYDRVLFADSSVVCQGVILGKAKDEIEARYMLKLQSNSLTSVYTAMKFITQNMIIDMLSIASYKFKKFDNDDLDRYIASNLWQGKAGAMMIEGFNKKYIEVQKGNKPTAMGLDIINLKAFL